MAHYLTDDAICLRVTDFSETSQIAGLFTRRHGVVPMIAKGSKRQTKKSTMSGPLDLLTSGEVVYVPARGAAELSTLAGWELTDHRAKLRRDLAGLNAAMMCAEATILLAHPHEPHEPLFLEFEAGLQLLAGPQSARALAAYFKAALDAAGYAPQLEICVACGKAVTMEAPLRFYPRAGGVACSRCQPPGGPCIELPGRIALALARLPGPRALMAAPPERAPDMGALAKAMEVLLAQVEAVTDRQARTRHLLASIFTPGIERKE
jgi:DNA repair protein RecO (recombination protein O)